MEPSRLPLEGQGYRTPLGELDIWVPSASLVLVRMTGVGDARFAGPVLEHFDAAAKAGAPVHLFVDFQRLDTYESGLRTRATAHLGGQRQNIGGLHVLVRSRLVAMGVAVANLALGGIIRAHSQRASFSEALDRELRAQGVVGFSSAVLAA